jgi:hypothetical protein
MPKGSLHDKKFKNVSRTLDKKQLRHSKPLQNAYIFYDMNSKFRNLKTKMLSQQLYIICFMNR